MTTERIPVASGAARIAMALGVAVLALLASYTALRATRLGALPPGTAAGAGNPAIVAGASPTVTRSSVENGAPASVGAPVLLRGRVRGVASGANFVVDVGLGEIAPADRAERAALQATGQSVAPLADLCVFEQRVKSVLAADGRFEIALALAARYQVIVHDGERYVALERDAAEAEPTLGGPRILDLGDLEIPALTALRITLAPAVSSAGDPEPLVRGPFSIEIARVEPTPAGNAWARVVPRLAPEFAAACLHGVLLALDGTRVVAPFLADERWNVTVVSESGLRSRPFAVTAVRGTVHELSIPLDAAFPRGELTRYRGRLVFAPDGAPIGGAELSVTGLRALRSAPDGRFEFVTYREDSRVLTVRDFDTGVAERVEHVAIAPSDVDGERTYEIEATRWLEVRGLAPPPEITSTEPVAYRLERRRPGEGWRSFAFERIESTTESVAVNVSGGEAEYRLVAVWSAIHSVACEPTVLLAGDRRAVTSFAIPSTALQFLAGRIAPGHVGGSSATGVLVEATSAGCGGIPPVAVRSDRSGRFVLGPIRADRIEVIAHLPSGTVVREVDPRLTTELVIEAAPSAPNSAPNPLPDHPREDR